MKFSLTKPVKIGLNPNGSWLDYAIEDELIHALEDESSSFTKPIYKFCAKYIWLVQHCLVLFPYGDSSLLA